MESRATQLLPSYHLVLPGHSTYVYSTTTAEFCQHLQLIATTSLQPQSESALTFDDCHASQFRWAFPLLERYGLRARFFAIAGRIGKRIDFMTWQQLKELVAAGHEVQSHSLSHVPLTHCCQSELSVEVSTSRAELEQRLGVRVNAISVPFGRWDHRVIEACARAGYHHVYTSDPGPPLQLEGVDLFGRFIVRRSTRLEQLRRVLTGDRRELLWLKRKQQCTLMARASVGDRVYFTLWAMLRSSKKLLAASRTYHPQAEPR